MKLGENLRNELVNQSSKTFLERIEPYLFQFVNDLEKGCILKLKNFSRNERKDVIKLLEEDEIKVIGKVSYSKNLFYDELDLKSMNEEYYLIWDVSAIEEYKFTIPYPCDNCTTTECQDGYYCRDIDDWFKNDGKGEGTSYNVSKKICVEKCELGYKVGVIK